MTIRSRKADGAACRFVSPDVANWFPGRKGGRSGRDDSTQGLGPASNCSVCAGRVQNYGAVLRGRSSIRYRTASRFAIRACPIAGSGVSLDVWIARSGLKAARFRGACFGRHGGLLRRSAARTGFGTCPEARSGRCWSPSCPYGSICRCGGPSWPGRAKDSPSGWLAHRGAVARR